MKKNFGKVPSYIKQYAKEKQMQAMKNLYQERVNLIPQGKRVVPEPERQATLIDLIEA